MTPRTVVRTAAFVATMIPTAVQVVMISVNSRGHRCFNISAMCLPTTPSQILVTDGGTRRMTMVYLSSIANIIRTSDMAGRPRLVILLTRPATNTANATNIRASVSSILALKPAASAAHPLFFWIFAQVSRSPRVRLKTGLFAVPSGSEQK